MASVDVVIPVYRPDEKLNRLLIALKTQTILPEKIILVHTGEVLPGEPDYSAYHNVVLHIIEPRAFDHGGTRNLGASLSEAEVMVFMTQDAVPADDHLLERLMRALTGVGDENCASEDCTDAAYPIDSKDEQRIEIAAAYARQLPYEDCRAVERYIREFNYPGSSELRTKKDISVRGIKTFCNSNVCSAYRKEIFDRLGGFETRTIFNEDLLYGAKAVLNGYGIRYEAEARVYHSHNLGLSDQFHRNFDNAVSQAEHPEIFIAVSSEKEGMRLVKYCISRMKEERKLYLVPYFVLNCACRYAGFFLGKRFSKLPGKLIKVCSLNKRYWT